MAAKPLTTEAIAVTEKKMDMTLDDIIKMSKSTSKDRMQRRVPNKTQKFANTLTQDKSAKVRRYMESRSSLRQGVLAKRRSNFQGNQFPVAAEVAQKAAVAPLRNRASNRSRAANWNKARFGVPPIQRRAGSGISAAKSLPSRQQQQQQPQQDEVNMMPKQKPQTLDSLFANMKEQRMRELSRKNNAMRHNGGGDRRPPWGRGRFGS